MPYREGATGVGWLEHLLPICLFGQWAGLDRIVGRNGGAECRLREGRGCKRYESDEQQTGEPYGQAPYSGVQEPNERLGHD